MKPSFPSSPEGCARAFLVALASTGLFACSLVRTLPLSGNPETLRADYGSLPLGERVTVYDQAGRRYDGPLLRADPDTMTIAVNPTAAPHALPTREVASLDWKGPRFGIAGGMLIGFAAGAAVGGLIGTALHPDSCPEDEGALFSGCYVDPGVYRFVYASSGSAIGMISGGIVGALYHPIRRWKIRRDPENRPREAVHATFPNG